MNRYLLAVAFFLFIGEPTFCQTGKDSSTMNCKTGNLDDEPSATITSIEIFLSELKLDVKEDNRDKVAKLVHYPLLVSTPSGRSYIHSQIDFKARYNEIVPSALKTLLLRQQAKCVSRVGAQGFTIGNGEVWFDVFSDGNVKIFTISPVVISDQ